MGVFYCSEDLICFCLDYWDPSARSLAVTLPATGPKQHCDLSRDEVTILWVWFPQREDKGWWGLGVSSLISENPEMPFSGIFYLVSGSFELGPLRVSGLPHSQEQKSELSILYVTQIRQHLGSPGKS